MSDAAPLEDEADDLAPAEDAPRPHELATFMRQDAAEMQSEYDRIRSISTEDPGTAGDEGEETWAALLWNWLPESYQVVTKGRLLAADGRRGPQLDLLVLRPGYPRRLINKKLYLVGGVAAAFECKNTLKAHHLERAFEQAQVIDGLSSLRSPTAFSELVPEVFFGVLAHSTVWTLGTRGPAATNRWPTSDGPQRDDWTSPGSRSRVCGGPRRMVDHAYDL